MSRAEYVAGAGISGVHRHCPARAELDLTAAVHSRKPYSLCWHGQAEIYKAETGLKSRACGSSRGTVEARLRQKRRNKQKQAHNYFSHDPYFVAEHPTSAAIIVVVRLVRKRLSVESLHLSFL